MTDLRLHLHLLVGKVVSRRKGKPALIQGKTTESVPKSNPSTGAMPASSSTTPGIASSSTTPGTHKQRQR